MITINLQRASTLNAPHARLLTLTSTCRLESWLELAVAPSADTKKFNPQTRVGRGVSKPSL